MRKIIFFIDSLVGAGAQRQIVYLASNINMEKYEPIVLIYYARHEFGKQLDKAGVRVICMPKTWKVDPIFFVKIVRLFRNEKPDIVQSYLRTPNFWARLASKVSGVKHVVTSERNIDISSSRISVLLERVLHRLSSKIVVNANAIKKLLVQDLDIPESKIQVIYNGVDIEKFSTPSFEKIDMLRAAFGFSEEDMVLTLPGRIAPQKNHACLVNAAQILKSDNKRIKVLFVGEEIDTDIKQSLVNMISEFRLKDSVVFAGWQADMTEIYALTDVVVLPSLWEGFPNVLLEAMAAGCPVVASDIADNRRLVKSGVNGFIFPSCDYLGLAQILDDLIDEGRENMRRIGQEGKSIIAEKYSVDRMVKSYERLYERLS